MTNKDFDKIYDELESLMKQSESVEQLREKVSKKYEDGPVLSDLRVNKRNTHIVKRPSIPTREQIGSYNGRYECFSKLISYVDYGVGNSSEYVDGHAEALKKYYAQAQSTPNDLTLIEARVNDEITKYNHLDKNNVYVKGYYDGLLYVYRALRKSKDLIVTDIYEKLRRGLGE